MTWLPWRALALTLLIGMVLVAYSYWLRRDTDPLSDTTSATQLGYYLLDARITETTATGAQRLQLSADRITQRLSDNSISLERVLLHYVTNNHTWQLSADAGQLPAQAQSIDFSGHVQVASTTGQARLRTQSLHVDLVNSQARTNEVVTLSLDGQQLTARGLHADLKQQQLQLESRVHGVFNAQP